MNEIESSLHLYQPPLYLAPDGSAHRAYGDALRRCGADLRWEPATVLSILSFNFAAGDRTLVREIRRRPWLSEVEPEGALRLQPIPPHDTLWLPTATSAAELGRRLAAEALRVCCGRSEIYVLLSGGLDSRIVAGTVARLHREGRLASRPVAVTWGLPDSRDVAYGREAARILDLEWIHVDLEPRHVVENVSRGVTLLGCLISPLHLHRMAWFEGVSPEAIVLAGNYGDMVGRAEFSGSKLLELRPLRPSDQFDLMSPDARAVAQADLRADLAALHERDAGAPRYVQCEHEMHGHYTRCLIAHAMSVIGSFCSVYQMFTDPAVYGYMWSLHPSLRTDRIYAALLEDLDPRLARLPWARTNRALRGATHGARADLRRDFHDYASWISGPVYEELGDFVDPAWYEATGLFDAERVEALHRMVRGESWAAAQLYGPDPFEAWLWLAGFRRFADWLEELGRSARYELPPGPAPARVAAPRPGAAGLDTVRRALRSSRLLHRAVSHVRRALLGVRARILYPAKKVR